MKKYFFIALLIIGNSAFSDDVKIKVDKDLAENDAKNNDGFALSNLRETSALYKAGARNGDRILKIGPKTIDSVAAFAENAQQLTAPANRVKVLILRDGEEMTLIIAPKK